VDPFLALRPLPAHVKHPGPQRCIVSHEKGSVSQCMNMPRLPAGRYVRAPT
jgi:hypothetical protein